MACGTNPLNAELNPIFHLLALLGAHRILHVSRIRVNVMIPLYTGSEGHLKCGFLLSFFPPSPDCFKCFYFSKKLGITKSSSTYLLDFSFN